MKIILIFLLQFAFTASNFVLNQSDQNSLPKSITKDLKKLYKIEDSNFGIKKLKHQEETSSPSFSGYFEVSSKGELCCFVYVGRVNTCRADGCSNPENNPSGEASEFFDYYIVFSKDKRVEVVRVFNYEATHGHEVSAKGWLKQFVGYDTSKTLIAGKNIDAISGATISVHAIIEDIKYRTIAISKIP